MVGGGLAQFVEMTEEELGNWWRNIAEIAEERERLAKIK
jgi:hypothetical protein